LAFLFAGVFVISAFVVGIVVAMDLNRDGGEAAPSLSAMALFTQTGLNQEAGVFIRQTLDNNFTNSMTSIVPGSQLGPLLGQIRLFPHIVGESNPFNMPLTGQGLWTPVYLNNGVLTLLGPSYRRSVFGGNNIYSTSTVRTVLNNDFNHFRNNLFPSINDFLVASSNVPGNLHSVQPDFAVSNGVVHNPAVPAGDMIFLPSGHELRNLWSVTGGGIVWTRSSFTANAHPHDTVSFAHIFGTSFTHDPVSMEHGIRPAIHINVANFPQPQPPVPTHVVAFNLQGGILNGSTASFTQEVLSNRPAQRPMNPTRAGHTFSHWSTSPVQGVGNTSVFDFGSGVTWNMTLHAVWIAHTNRTLILHNQNVLMGATVANQNLTLRQGYSYRVGIDIPSPAQSGLVFVGWAFSLARANTQLVDLVEGSTYIMPAGNRTLFAVWQNAGSQFIPFGDIGGLVHLNGVGGSTADMTTTWYYNPFVDTTMQLPTATYMNTTFRENNPDFISRTFDGWVMEISHMSGSIASNQRFTRIPQYTGNAVTSGEVEFFARWV